jgi:hypothetical protein
MTRQASTSVGQRVLWASRDVVRAGEQFNMGGKTMATQLCAAGVCDPQRTQGLKAPAPKGDHLLIHLKGPGVFLGAEVTKQGGNTDLTFVILDIDGRNVTNLSYAAAKNAGLTQQNPYGLVMLSSAALKTLTIGFPTPLRFKKELKLSVTVNEVGVVQILGNVIHGK